MRLGAPEPWKWKGPLRRAGSSGARRVATGPSAMREWCRTAALHRSYYWLPWPMAACSGLPRSPGRGRTYSTECRLTRRAHHGPPRSGPAGRRHRIGALASLRRARPPCSCSYRAAAHRPPRREATRFRQIGKQQSASDRSAWAEERCRAVGARALAGRLVRLGRFRAGACPCRQPRGGGERLDGPVATVRCDARAGPGPKAGSGMTGSFHGSSMSLIRPRAGVRVTWLRELPATVFLLTGAHSETCRPCARAGSRPGHHDRRALGSWSREALQMAGLDRRREGRARSASSTARVERRRRRCRGPDRAGPGRLSRLPRGSPRAAAAERGVCASSRAGRRVRGRAGLFVLAGDRAAPPARIARGDGAERPSLPLAEAFGADRVR